MTTFILAHFFSPGTTCGWTVPPSCTRTLVCTNHMSVFLLGGNLLISPLVPYCDLDENAKDPDREVPSTQSNCCLSPIPFQAALTVISSLIKWGFCIAKSSGDLDSTLATDPSSS